MGRPPARAGEVPSGAWADASRARAPFPYGVFFRETDEVVVVLAVVHSHRDPLIWRSWLKPNVRCSQQGHLDARCARNY